MAANGPRIPERLIDAPSQRLYILSLGLALQALKLVAFFTSLIEGNSITYFLKWMLCDAAFLLFLRFLRIPLLTFRWQSSALQIALLGMVNWLMFGNYTISFSFASVVPTLVYNLWVRLRGDYVGINGYTVSFTELLRGDKHLIGQHTVKLSPISTAKLNPYLESICIPPHIGHAFVPILFNNTDPSQITYKLTQHTADPSVTSAPSSTVTVRKKDILTHVDWSQSESPSEEGGGVVTTLSEDEAFDLEFGESDDPRAVAHQQHQQQQVAQHQKSLPELQRTQRLRWIRVTKPGTLRLESVVDGRTDVRLRDSEVPVVMCPTALFAPAEKAKENWKEKVSCRGDKEVLVMLMVGVPPMSLEYQRVLGNKREETTVEGIDPVHKEGDARALTSKELRIPLALTLDELGEHVYTLNTITDGLGNTVDLTLPLSPHHRTKVPHDITRTISVLKPAEFSFNDCRGGRTVDLLQGKDAQLQFIAGHHDERDGPWKLSVQFTPLAGADVGKGGKGKNTPWVKEITAKGKFKKLRVEAPGEYKLLAAQGQVCKGDILSPELCRVVEVPMPKAEIEWRKLHECSGDVGVTANLVLHGTPPFTVFHTTSHNGGAEVTNSTVINGSRGEITLQPGHKGSYVYRLTALSDAHYDRIPLQSEPIKQTVHPLANANFAGNNRGAREKTVQSCSGDVVDVPVSLDGTAPWTLELQVVGPSGITEKMSIPGIKSNEHTLKVKIPKEVDRDGGTILVDLISVEDANGCKRSLAVPGVTVNVRRVKPTAKFYSKDGQRKVEILMGETAHLPLRLTGDGPWRVEYRDVKFPRNPNRQRVQSANDVIAVEAEGTYEIVSVRDAHCPGEVVVPEHTYTVSWVPRPAARILDTVRTPQVANGSYIRPPVCVFTDDHIVLDLRGSPPFQVNYDIKHGKDRPEKHSFTSLQTEHRVQLQTSKPGRMVYQVTSVGDARYSVKEDHGKEQHPRWEQQVLARPSAYFKTDTRLSYCLNDAFMPRPESHLSNDGVVVLEGKAPFMVSFSIHNLASSETRQEIKEFTSHEWHLSFPGYVFSTVGSYLITINSVRDASSCEEIVDETTQRSIWVDVAETAMIVPYERRTDVCVGDLLQFQLEGTAPWTITYRFNNKVQKTIQKTPKYTTVANVPGEFSVVSIAHQQAQCQTSVSDVRLLIHEIPSAQVSHGSRFEENIREGEQAEIVFTLIGEPPFTFTYQRAELAQYARGRKPKVLETHTVAGVMSTEYSIFSSAEGTWTVTFIADKWCRYPPAKTDPSIEAV